MPSPIARTPPATASAIPAGAPRMIAPIAPIKVNKPVSATSASVTPSSHCLPNSIPAPTTPPAIRPIPPSFFKKPPIELDIPANFPPSVASLPILFSAESATRPFACVKRSFAPDAFVALSAILSNSSLSSPNLSLLPIRLSSKSPQKPLPPVSLEIPSLSFAPVNKPAMANIIVVANGDFSSEPPMT